MLVYAKWRDNARIGKTFRRGKKDNSKHNKREPGNYQKNRSTFLLNHYIIL